MKTPPRRNWPKTVRPRRGRPYARCPICQGQVYVPTSKKTASETQMGFAAAVALATHKRTDHSEGRDDDSE
jgi:hypothetical protein